MLADRVVDAIHARMRGRPGREGEDTPPHFFLRAESFPEKSSEGRLEFKPGMP